MTQRRINVPQVERALVEAALKRPAVGTASPVAVLKAAVPRHTVRASRGDLVDLVTRQAFTCSWLLRMLEQHGVDVASTLDDIEDPTGAITRQVAGA